MTNNKTFLTIRHGDTTQNKKQTFLPRGLSVSITKTKGERTVNEKNKQNIDTRMSLPSLK